MLDGLITTLGSQKIISDDELKSLWPFSAKHGAELRKLLVGLDPKPKVACSPQQT